MRVQDDPNWKAVCAEVLEDRPADAEEPSPEEPASPPISEELTPEEPPGVELPADAPTEEALPADESTLETLPDEDVPDLHYESDGVVEPTGLEEMPYLVVVRLSDEICRTGGYLHLHTEEFEDVVMALPPGYSTKSRDFGIPDKGLTVRVTYEPEQRPSGGNDMPLGPLGLLSWLVSKLAGPGGGSD